MVIADEASGIPDDNYGVLTGGLSGKNDRMLMTSQPTKSSGFFRESHHKLAKYKDGTRTANKNGVWNSLTFSSIESPWASTAFILEKKEQYTEEQFDIKVLGLFPDNVDGFLLGRREVEESCFEYESPCVSDDDSWGYMNSIDIGGGSYRDSSVLINAKVVGDGDYGDNARRMHIVDIPFYSNKLNEHEFASRAWEWLVGIGMQYETLMVDAGGMGRATVNYLERLGAANMVSVLWGIPCFKRKNKEMYINKRAQAVVATAKAVRDGRLTIDRELPYRAQILDEASRIPFAYDDNARYKIEKKEKMKSDGIPSPDLWDAISFMWLEGSYYSPYGGAVTQFDSEKQKAIDKMMEEAENLFDDA